MDEAIDDDTKDLGQFQQRGTPAADSEDAVAESMDEAMDGDFTTTTAPTPHTGAPRPANWDQLTRGQNLNWKRRKKEIAKLNQKRLQKL